MFDAAFVSGVRCFQHHCVHHRLPLPLQGLEERQSRGHHLWVRAQGKPLGQQCVANRVGGFHRLGEMWGHENVTVGKKIYTVVAKIKQFRLFTVS